MKIQQQCIQEKCLMKCDVKQFRKKEEYFYYQFLQLNLQNERLIAEQNLQNQQIFKLYAEKNTLQKTLSDIYSL